MNKNRYLFGVALLSAGAAVGIACTGDPATVVPAADGSADTSASDSAIDTGKDGAVVDTGIDALPPVFGTGKFGNELYLPLAGPDGGATAANYGIAAGDVNGDKHLDLVISGGGSNSVLVYLGKGNGTFEAPVAYGTGANPYYVTIADLNGDQKPDLATANYTGGNVSVLIGAGNGTFAAATSYTTGPNTVFVIAADVNGDNVKDLVATELGGKVDVLVNSGTGTFAAAVPFVVPSPWNVAATDLNGDSKLDLVVGTGNASIYVLLNSGNGSLFNAPIAYATDPADSGVVNGAYATIVGDYNGDGMREVAIAKCGGSNLLTFAPAATNGTLGAVQASSVTSVPAAVCLYDMTQGLLDPDTIPDLVMGGHAVYVRSSSLLDGGPEASVSEYVPDAGGALVKTIAVGDLNEDGVQDLAAVVGGKPFAYLLFGVKK